MILTVSSFKGGVSKTTSAIHLAHYLALSAPTVLIDSDPNRSALFWASHGKLPFNVVDDRQAAKVARNYEHVVIDTPARPLMDDLRALAEGCDLLILPSTPDGLALDALMMVVATLQKFDCNNYRALLTIVPPRPSRDGEEARAALGAAGVPLFKSQVRRAVAFQRAALEGVTVHNATDPRARAAWEDYASIGREITG